MAAVHADAGSLPVSDLATKKPEVVKVSSESQLRKLPPQMAQMIAMRLKGAAAGTPAAANSPAPATGRGDAPGGQGRNGGGDLQQLLGRLPAARLSEFQKGDVVMIVATSGPKDAQVTAITDLRGAEPLLQATTQHRAP